MCQGKKKVTSHCHSVHYSRMFYSL